MTLVSTKNGVFVNPGMVLHVTGDVEYPFSGHEQVMARILRPEEMEKMCTDINSAIRDSAMLAPLREAVKAMRDAQKEYFRTRSKESLSAAKRLEAEVDRLLDPPRSRPDDEVQMDMFADPTRNKEVK